MTRTGAFGLPSVRPCWGMPESIAADVLALLTGADELVAEVVLLLPEPDTAMSTTTATTATATTAPRRVKRRRRAADAAAACSRATRSRRAMSRCSLRVGLVADMGSESSFETGIGLRARGEHPRGEVLAAL